MKIEAKGQLRHRFWGNYSAVIALAFPSAYAAKAALPLLGAGWTASSTSDIALLWCGDSEALNTCTDTLARFGADPTLVASLNKSIDYGEMFKCTFDVADPNQVTMDFGA